MNCPPAGDSTQDSAAFKGEAGSSDLFDSDRELQGDVPGMSAGVKMSRGCGGEMAASAPNPTSTSTARDRATKPKGDDHMGESTSSSKSPGWNVIVRDGKRQKGSKAASQVGVRPGNPAAAGRRKRQGVTIIGAVNNIHIVKTKLVMTFASRFTPDLDAETLSAYLSAQLDREVTCVKIATAHNRYGSFKVSAECKEISEKYSTELWPDGATVRHYYEPKQTGVAGANMSMRGMAQVS